MYIDEKGNKWYKGNLHTHTRESDGRRTVEECLRLYKDAGYDFLCITDHWKHREGGEFEGMTLLSGAEYDVYPGGMCHHITSLGCSADPELTRDNTPREIIDAIHALGGIANLAHPAWSLNTSEELLLLSDVDCTEIYNAVSGPPYSSRPYSGEIIDGALKRGMRVNLIASDDVHYYTTDVLSGFIYVKAESNSASDITEAVRRGDIYASSGPVISWEINDGVFSVFCPKGCKSVRFFSGSYWQIDAVTEGETVYKADFRIKPGDNFFRAEIVGKDGKFAYTNAFYK